MALDVATPAFLPPVPHTLEETGLNASLIEDLLLKRLFNGGPQTAGDVADRLALPFTAVLDSLNDMRRLHLTHVLGSEGYGERSYVYSITEEGEERARTAFRRNMYDAPAPVPLSDYVESVGAQSVRDVVIRRTDVIEAFRDLVLHEEVINEVGPAINAGQSLFFYGAAGNGKSALAARITRTLGSDVYVPYAVEVDGAIIEFFDPVCHTEVEREDGVDPRWMRVKRPAVVVGGELRLENLDLAHDPNRRTYEAPFQMKANTGMFLIDDFGRQQVSPTDLLNRWIVPLELRVDFLKLQSGRKIEIPFDQLLVFSTNLDPSSLVDEAFLRRIKFKVQARDPDLPMFKEIFRRTAATHGVPFDEDGFAYLVSEHYVKAGRPFRGVHPRDLLEQLVAMARYIDREPLMLPDLLDAVVRTYFIVPR